MTSSPLLVSSLCFILLRNANLKFVLRMLAWFSLENCLCNFGFRIGLITGFFSTKISFSSCEISFVKVSTFLANFLRFGFRETNFGFLNRSFKMKVTGIFFSFLLLSELTFLSSREMSTLETLSVNFLLITPWSDFSLILKLVKPKALSASFSQIPISRQATQKRRRAFIFEWTSLIIASHDCALKRRTQMLLIVVKCWPVCDQTGYLDQDTHHHGLAAIPSSPPGGAQ